MDKAVLASKIKGLCDYSNRLNSFENDEESFLTAIKGLSRKYLTGELDKFRDDSINWKGVLKPVNFLKFLIIDNILKEKNVSLDMISQFKDKILNRDVDYFKDYPDFKEAMLKLDEGKDYFRSWNNIFKILFYVYYDQYKNEVTASLTEISDHLKVVLNMKDCKTTLNGFGWNQNFGGSDCWFAFYPPDRDSHRTSYQLFLSIKPDYKVNYGMWSGADMEQKSKLDSQNGQNVNIETLERFLFTEAKPQYEKLNASVAFEQKTKATTETIVSIDEKRSRNLILYGPPGTGKTYEAYEEAVGIVEPGFKSKDRKELIDKFRELQKNGYITFVTFHQSYSYEEFIEGYRYDEEAKIPKVEPGVFKILVESARADILSPKKEIDLDLSKRNVFKMSLGNTLQGDEDIYEYCVENNVIALGWGGNVNYSKADTRDKVAKAFENSSTGNEDSNFNITAVNYFKNTLKKEDLVFVSKGNRALRAIGKVVGDYYYEDDVPIAYPHFRKVEWILVDSNIPVEKVMKVFFSQQTIYSIRKDLINEASLSELLAKPGSDKKKEKNYALIIDEINRGNISRIFGELITLIEDDKRLGMVNEMMVKLPYSKESDFGIPPNIYIIGTMNTADRSIALMDIALRRRFIFRKMAPDSKIIRDLLIEKGLNEEFVEIVENTFIILNKRIRALLDEDHMLGHSYFLKIGKEDPEYSLHAVWYDQVVPLLQEYFYNDWDKTRLILGDYNSDNKQGFVKTLKSEYKGILGSEYDDEYPYELVIYGRDNFSQVLKNTFTVVKN